LTKNIEVDKIINLSEKGSQKSQKTELTEIFQVDKIFFEENKKDFVLIEEENFTFGEADHSKLS